MPDFRIVIIAIFEFIYNLNLIFFNFQLYILFILRCFIHNKPNAVFIIL